MGIAAIRKIWEARSRRAAALRALEVFGPWIARVDATPREPYDADYGEWTGGATNRAQSIIGCYSEAFYACSYNDDSVLWLLLSGEMDQRAVQINASNDSLDFPDDHWFTYQMCDHLREDGQYAQQLMDAVEQAGMWPMATWRKGIKRGAEPTLAAYARHVLGLENAQ